MPNGTTLRRALLSAAALATLLTTQGASAQARDGQFGPVDAALPAELAVDRKLAEQYAGENSGPQPASIPGGNLEPAPVALPAAAGFDEAAAARLEQEIEAALAEAAAENKKQQQPAKPVFVTIPGPWSTAGLVIGALALLALVSLVLTLSVRELRQDAKQRRRTYRRRVRRRAPTAPATASAG